MSTALDSTATAPPAFRPDLEIVPRLVAEGRMRYLVRDPQTDEVFEFGAEEYALCTRMDGQTPLSEIQADFCRRFPRAMEPQQLEAFLRKIRRLGLLSGTAAGSAANFHLSTERELVLAQRPNRWLNGLAAVFGWCCGGWFAPLLLFTTLLAVGVAVANFDRFLGQLIFFHRYYGGGVFLLVPLFGFLVVLPVSEVAKAVCCRKFGGQVSDFRLRIYFRFLPVLIAGLRDSLWFMRQQERRRVLTAGLKSQLLLWAGATLAWQQSEPWSVLHVVFSLLSLAALLFLLVNLNPLVQKDGYGLLVDRWETENLKERAEEYFKSLIFRHPPPEALTARQQSRFRWYGLASLLFRSVLLLVIPGAIGYSLIDSFQGVGATLFIIFLLLRFEPIFWRTWLRMPVMKHLVTCENGRVKVRLLAKVGLLIAFCLVLVLPYPFEVGGEFRVLPARQLGIRAEVPGRIKQVLVRENQPVSQGNPVAVLEDRVHRKRIEAINAAIDEARAMLDLRIRGPKPEMIAKAEQEVATAAKNYKFSEQEFRRYQKMFAQQAIPETEYKLAERKMETDRENLLLAERNLALVKSGVRDEEIAALEAEIRRLEVERAQAEDDLRFTTLYSPMEGVVITSYLVNKIGQRLEAGDLFAVVENRASYLAEIEVPEDDITEVEIGAGVELRAWANPRQTLSGRVTAIAPVAYEKSWHRAERGLSDRELLVGQKEVMKEQGRVIRVLAEFPAEDAAWLRSDMTGYAKIASGGRPVVSAFSRWLVRFVMVEVWSWLP